MRLFRWPWPKRGAEPIVPAEKPYWHSWTPWQYRPPPDYELVLAMRAEWDAPAIIRRSECPPFMNVADLYWKPWTGVTIDLSSAPARDGDAAGRGEPA